MRKLIIEGNEAMDVLESDGIKLVETKANFNQLDTCINFLVKELRKRMPLILGLEDLTVIEKIEYLVRAGRININTVVPEAANPEDYLVFYLNSDIRSFIDYQEQDDTIPIERIPYTTHWGKVVRKDDNGLILVHSKMVYEGVYEHAANNAVVLDTFCKGNYFYFIELNELEEALSSEM